MYPPYDRKNPNENILCLMRYRLPRFRYKGQSQRFGTFWRHKSTDFYIKRFLLLVHSVARTRLVDSTCVPAPKCGRRPHFGAVGIAGLYIGRLRNCLPFLTSFTQCRMANLHIKCFDINAYQRLECYRALKRKT